MSNIEIITEITTAATQPEVATLEQLTGITIIAHYPETDPDTGDTIKRTTIRVEFGPTTIRLSRILHTTPWTTTVGWEVMDGDVYYEDAATAIAGVLNAIPAA